MGADASKDGSGSYTRTKSGSLSIIPRRGKSSLIAKWQKRQLSTQFFGIVRHAERADGIYAFVDGTRWHVTEDFKRWPLDPPLSDAGLEQAQEMGHYLEQNAADKDSVVHVVISSPYFRCIQTAVLICVSLGPGARLLVDRSLGEVYGPSVMGPTEPCSPIRSMEETLAYCSIHGVTCHSRIIGTWPTWPESLKDARRRYCLRFFSYLLRSETTRRNFILVAHGDTVGSVLSTMPSVMNQVVEKVDYGGLFVASRQRSEKREKARKASTSMTSVLPATAEEAAEPEEVTDLELVAQVDHMRDFKPQALHGNWMEEAVKEKKIMTTPKASDSWEVELHGITMRQRDGAKKFQSRLKALAAQSELSSRKIEQLLGDLADSPLGDDAVTCVQSTGSSGLARAMTERSGVVPSCYSVSTYLFGASEAGWDRELSTREFETLEDGMESHSMVGVGTSTSLIMMADPNVPESPREARNSRRCLTPQQMRAITPGTPRRTMGGRNGSPPQGHIRKASSRTLSSTGSMEIPSVQRAATMQAVARNSAAPVRTPSLGKTDELQPVTSDSNSRRTLTMLLPVSETQPAEQPAPQASQPQIAQLSSNMQGSALMRRRRSQGAAQLQTDCTRLRLLPNIADEPQREAVLETQLEATANHCTASTSVSEVLESSGAPSPDSPGSPTSPLRPSASGGAARTVVGAASALAPLAEAPERRLSEEAVPMAAAVQAAAPAPTPTPSRSAKPSIGFGGLDGSALLQRRRNKQKNT